VVHTATRGDAPSATTVHTIPRVAELLGCSENHAYRLIAAGQLEAIDIAVPGARRTKLRVTDKELARYIAQQARG
jgi:hypothetical protein